MPCTAILTAPAPTSSRTAGRPVPGGDLLPLDRGLDVDAERLGQDGGRDLGGQGEQGGAAALAGADPEGVEPLGERVLGQLTACDNGEGRPWPGEKALYLPGAGSIGRAGQAVYGAEFG